MTLNNNLLFIDQLLPKINFLAAAYAMKTGCEKKLIKSDSETNVMEFAHWDARYKILNGHLDEQFEEGISREKLCAIYETDFTFQE